MRDSGVPRPWRASKDHQAAPAIGERQLPRGRRSVERAVASALLAAALLTGSAGAFGQEDAATTMARDRFREGVQFFDQKQFDKARAAFLQAYALKRHPAVLLNLAQSELRSEHEADAAKHFSQYLREHKEASEAERQAAENGLTIARAKVAEVTVTVDEEGASVSVDGNPEGTSPLAGPVFLKPGTHTITANKDGREASSQLTVTAAQATSTALRLRKTTQAAGQPATKPAAAAPRPAPAPPIEAEPAREAAITAEASTVGTERQPFFEWARDTPVAWVMGGVGVLGLGGGVGFWIASRQSYADADAVAQKIRQAAEVDNVPAKGVCQTYPPNAGEERKAQYRDACSLYTENVDDGESYETLAIASGAVGVAALAGTVVYYFVAAPKKVEGSRAMPTRRFAITPWLGPAAQGVTVATAF